ncbi:MAG TPA: hypothetical protein VGL03_03905 [Thermoanaerobaculia bacterium]
MDAVLVVEGRGALASGFAALSHGKLILLLAVTTAVLGVSGAMPLSPALSDSVASTLAGDHFILNHPTFAPTDLFDFLHEKADAIRATRRAALWSGVLGVFLQLLFAGGIIAVVGHGPFTFGQFVEPARRNFWHNLKCFFLFVVAAAIVLGLWFGAGGAMTKRLFQNVPPDAAVRSVARWVTILVGVLLFAILSLLYDFARAARRHSPTIGAWRAFRFARRSLSGSWFRALGLFLFWLVLGGVAVLLLFAIVWEMPATSPIAIALLILLQFSVLWVRSAVRVAAWGSYIGFLEPRARPALSSMARVTYTVARSAAAPRTAG